MGDAPLRAHRRPGRDRVRGRQRTRGPAARTLPGRNELMSLRSVLVTGGASGLGAAVVEAVRAAGGNPLVIDLKPPPVDVPYASVDLADPRAAEAAVRSLAEEAGG